MTAYARQRLKASRRRSPPLFVTAILAASFLTGAARAQTAASANDAPPAKAWTYSAYEQQAIKDALEGLHATVDTAAEGKTIEAIDVVPLEVIQRRVTDPLGSTLGSLVFALNHLHATTRPYVVERELLVHVGDPWQQFYVDETSRALRRIPQLSLAICVPLVGSAPDKVRLLTITQDVWSLRFNSNFKFGPGGLESLLMQPTESNLAGTQQTVYGRFTMLPESYSLGAGYAVPRLVGKRLAFSADANIIMNSDRAKAEGSFGSVEIGRPLFSTRSEWAWSVSTIWRDEVIRRYVNARLSTFNAKVTPDNDHIPYEYRGRRITETAAVTRSYGVITKSDFSVGLELNNRSYYTPPLPSYDPAAVSEFVRTILPVSDKRAGPFVQYHGYGTKFLRVLDFETLGRQEDYRIGHDVYLRLYPVLKAVGSSRDFVGSYAAAVYTVQLGSDGLARAAVESSVEAETERISDASVSGSARFVTPRLGFGRFVVDGVVLSRYRNYLNRLTFLGGDTRLRGYPSAFFIGKDVVAANAEFRTRPFEILSAQVGAAVFYDVGNAFDGFRNLTLHHAAGVGVRLLIPQLDKVVLRGDVGFPIPSGGRYPAGVSPASFFVAFEQAFGLPGATGGPGSGLLGQ